MKTLIIALAALLSLAACTNYGKKVTSGHIEVYYKDGISKEEAEKTAKLMYDADIAAGNKTDKKSIQLTKTGDTINFRMVAVLEKLKDVEDIAFLNMGNVLSDSIFPGKPVNVDLTNNKFTTIRTIHYKKVDYAGANEENAGTRYSAGNIEVFAGEDIGAVLATDLAEMLNKDINPANTISFRISKNDKGNFVLKMVTAADKVNQLSNEQLDEMCNTISDKVLNGAPMVFELTDAKFNTLRSFAYPSGATPDSLPN
jgi:predicted nucleic acid-binding protein